MMGHGETIARNGGPRRRRHRVEEELRHLRRQLADAWWYELPLEAIQELERRIAQRRRELTEIP